MGHSRPNQKLRYPALLHLLTPGHCCGGGRGVSSQEMDQINTKRPLTSTNVLEDGHKRWVGVTLRSPLSFP